MHAAETALAELKGSAESTEAALAGALEGEKRAADDAAKLRVELSTTKNSLLRVQVRAVSASVGLLLPSVLAILGRLKCTVVFALNHQVEAQMQVSAAERGWATRIQDAEATAAEMTERCRVAEEIAAGEATAHATLLARLASPMVSERRTGPSAFDQGGRLALGCI